MQKYIQKPTNFWSTDLPKPVDQRISKILVYLDPQAKKK